MLQRLDNWTWWKFYGNKFENLYKINFEKKSTYQTDSGGDKISNKHRPLRKLNELLIIFSIMKTPGPDDYFIGKYYHIIKKNIILILNYFRAKEKKRGWWGDTFSFILLG